MLNWVAKSLLSPVVGVDKAEVNGSGSSVSSANDSSQSLSSIEPTDVLQQAVRLHGAFTAENFLRVANEDNQFLKAMQAGTQAYRKEGPPIAYLLVLGLSRKASNSPEDITQCEARGLFYLKGLEYFLHVSPKQEVEELDRSILFSQFTRSDAAAQATV